MVFEKILIRIKKNTLTKQQKSQAILTEKNLTWWENKRQHSLSLADVVGVCSVEDKLNQYSFIVNAYPLVSSTLFARKRQLREYKFACTSAQERSQWLKAINNSLYGQETTPSRRLQIILNPQSGKKKARNIFRQILPLLEKSNIQFNIIQTRAQGHAQDIIQEINLQQIDGLVVIGGDGTIYEVINGLMSRADCDIAIKIPLGIIPAGTGNGLCKTILDISGEPFHHISAAFVIAKGKQQPLDLISTQQENKHYHNLLSLSWGFVSDVDIESDRLKYLGSFKNDIYALLRIYHLRSYKGKFSFLPATVTDNQWQVIEDKFILIWAMNIPWAAHNLKPAPSAHLADGSMDVLIIRDKISKWQLLSAFLKCSHGEHLSLPYVEYYKVRALHLEPLTNLGIIAVDGEQVDYLPIQMEVRQGVVSIFCQ